MTSGDVKEHSHGSTVFISNLPYTATSTDLKTHFSDIAPIKNAFVVLEKETKVSKGVGYVTFSLREDAEQCVEKGSVEMNGRMLRVSWAAAKGEQGENAQPKGQRPSKVVRSPVKDKAHDATAVRTIIITGLPTGIDSKVLWKKVRKQEGAETLEFPFKNVDGSEDPTKANVVFTSPTQALHAVEKLNAHVYKGSLLGVTLKKRLEKKPNRSSRLIVRNLPWDTTDSDLRALFLPHGAVYSIEIPTDKVDGQHEGRKPKAKGFAFVWMLSRADAEKAIEGVNGKSLKERPLAVDWALSKAKWEDVKEKMEVDAEPGHEEEESDEDSNSALGVHSDGDVSMHSAHEDEEEEAPTKPELPAPEAGTTLFIRNVPWEATEDEMRQLLRGFGPLRYVRIVIDQESGRSKGTAFACYWNKEDADKVITASETLNKESGVNASPIKNPFSAPSLLTPDPSSSLARNLVVHGRTLDVVRAVTRETADKLRDAGVKMREKADKRNLYLMREGVIFPNSPAASTITPTELEKRVNAFNQRRTLLRTNPSLYVSKTRLSIRQLPTFVSERSLKRLAHHSIREFDNEVKNGDRDGLAEDEIDDDQRTITDELMGDKVALPEKPTKDKPTKKGGKRGSGSVKQAKIVRISERVDPFTGKGRSKGYGFIEMERHSDALKVLRWANNNPDVGPLLKSWWAEELKDLFDTLEKKGDKRTEEEKARYKRLKDALEEIKMGVTKASTRTLVVEFSIENMVIVKKREERGTPRQVKGEDAADEQTSKRSSHPKGRDKKKTVKMEEDHASETTRSAKRRKKEASEEQSPEPKSKSVNPLGSMIGRKRRLKKARGGKA